jgi:glycosyltransferase involved in cell wall biosynthesis
LCLLRAYLSEFQATEEVVLVLKSYRVDTSEPERQIIRNDIQTVKKSLRLNSYPPVVFFPQLMTSDEIKSLHARGDCFVLPHKGEGFGIPLAEAMSYGKPTISTNYGGNLEFMDHENGYLIDYQMTPVYGMIFPNYHGKMNWAEPSTGHLKKIMREVFENQKAAVEKGLLGRQTIKENFNKKVIGGLMLQRLRKIQGSL